MTQKEKATKSVSAYPSTHALIKELAARHKITMAELLDRLTQPKALYLTSDYENALEIKLGEEQTISSGGTPMRVTSVLNSSQTVVSIDLAAWLEAQHGS